MKRKQIVEKKKKFFTKQKTLAYGMGGFIILLMVASGLNMWKGDTTETYDYNGLKFTKTEEGFWIAYKGEQQIALTYNPEDLETITFPQNIATMNYFQKIYISTDDLKGNGRAMDYFKRKITITNMKPFACTEDNEGCAELPLKSCEDTTQTEGVVIFKRAEETKITYSNNCLVMEGASENLIKAIDKLYFILTGI
ncbi:MAG: hypothetical protein KKA79_00495 [Nanoarchaeota archaeon]|nr:hypothetical protein [Nanoarchaeota archaeon]MCG2717306.1 hypothetical protein [Nanoarchaeota archaeon]